MFADTLHKNFWNISTFPFHDLSRRLRADPRISVLLSVTDTNRRPGLVASTPLLCPFETRTAARIPRIGAETALGVNSSV